MIVQFGHPSPWHVGQSSRRLYSARAVRIRTRPRRVGVHSLDRRPHPRVDRVDPLLLRRSGDALCRLHRGVRRRLVFRGFDDHAARRLRDRLGARDVGQRDDDVVVRREDVGDAPARHDQAPFGASFGVGAPGSSGSSGPSSSPPSAAGGAGGCPVCRTGCKSLEIAERSSYVMTFSSVRLTRTRGIVTRRPPTDTWPWTMNCRAWRGVKARPLRNVSVWSRRERIASTSRARTSSRVVPSSGRSPRRPSRRRSCSRSFSACLSFCRTRACSSRARWRNRRRTNWERQSSFLFFSPYFFRSSFSALMRSASHGWEGRSNFARENFGSPNDSHLGRFLLLFLLFFFLLRLLAAGFLRLLRLRGFEGGLLRDADGQAGPAVGPRALPADLLARLVAHALVRSDHLHQVDVVPQPHLDVGTERVEVEPRLPVFRPVHHPMREHLAEVAQGRLDLVRILLREVAEAFRPGDAREVDDRLGDADPDAGDRGERVRDGPCAVEVRVRHADDVSEVLLDALELLWRARRFRLLLGLFLLPRGPLGLLGLRRGRRGYNFRAWLLLRH